MNKVKFSIICPVYNSDLYLSECIESVIRQSFFDWELILVDDGSTDNSSCICDYYANKFNNIKTFHKKNKGQYYARIDGLKLSKGKYIIFLDSDDLLSNDCLDKISEFCDRFDIVVFNMKTFSFDGSPDRPFYHIDSIDEYNNQDAFKFFYFKSLIFNLCRCCFDVRLFTHDVFAYSELSKSKIGEDSVFFEKIIKKTKSVCTIPFELYQYRMHPNSATHLISFDNALSRVKVLDYLYKDIEINIKNDKRVIDRLTWPLLTAAFYSALINKYHIFKANVKLLYSFNIYKKYFNYFESDSRFYKLMSNLFQKRHLFMFYVLTRLNKRKVC